MENRIIQQNKYHHNKVLKTKMYKDKICNRLLENETRDRILNRNLRRDKCKDNNIYDFLLLLKRNAVTLHSITTYQPIVINE